MKELSMSNKFWLIQHLQVGACHIVGTLYDEGKSEYNFGLHPKNHRSGLGHTLGDQNQPLFKSPHGSP